MNFLLLLEHKHNWSSNVRHLWELLWLKDFPGISLYLCARCVTSWAPSPNTPLELCCFPNTHLQHLIIFCTATAKWRFTPQLGLLPHVKFLALVEGKTLTRKASSQQPVLKNLRDKWMWPEKLVLRNSPLFVIHYENEMKYKSITPEPVVMDTFKLRWCGATPRAGGVCKVCLRAGIPREIPPAGTDQLLLSS